MQCCWSLMYLLYMNGRILSLLGHVLTSFDKQVSIPSSNLPNGIYKWSMTKKNITTVWQLELGWKKKRKKNKQILNGSFVRGNVCITKVYVELSLFCALERECEGLRWMLEKLLCRQVLITSQVFAANYWKYEDWSNIEKGSILKLNPSRGAEEGAKITRQ